MNIKRPLAVAVALMFVAGAAHADEVSELKAQMEAMQKQMDALKARLEQVTNQVQQTQQAQQQQEKKNAQFLQRQEGSGLTFLTPGGGDVTLVVVHLAQLVVDRPGVRRGSQRAGEEG